ncbi:hypothetical protein B4168_4137 [Anoxybacillus flavithermus]|nr:hypothetical protein B4168_4137 [Anoxybacillus flavithermus]OAO86015.1 hypothetical protein GT23_2355 [Parageobacillus thermoglucosidasius]
MIENNICGDSAGCFFALFILSFWMMLFFIKRKITSLLLMSFMTVREVDLLKG